MKPAALTIVLLIVVAAATGFVSYRLSGDAEVKSALAHGDALTWMRAEFRLSEEQFGRIKLLHDSYAQECEKHCRAIQAAARAKRGAEQSGDAESTKAADAELQQLRATCENAIAAHVRRCAAEMSPDSAERYLAMVLPKIADFDHQAPPDVRMNAHSH